MNRKQELPKIWGKGPLKIYDIEVECYILQDGTPLFNKGKMMKAIGRSWKGASRSEMPNFIGAKNIQPFISDELKELVQGVDFLDGNRVISGYHANILPLVCETYLDARNAGVLTATQLPIAQKCEMLTRAFMRAGVTGYIYEQLGYEKYKHPEALKFLIESYLADEVRRWSKEFPDDLFQQMDRIYGNFKTTSRNRPQYYAKFIRKYIYDPIEKGMVLNKLDEVNPVNEKGNRPRRHHQHLNQEKGLPALRAHIWQVVGLLKSCPNKRAFEYRYKQMMGLARQLNLFED